MQGDRTVDASRERRVGELAGHFDTLASRPGGRSGLEVFYTALPDLDTHVPSVLLIMGRREPYEEDLAVVRAELRKLDSPQLEALADNLREFLEADGPAGTGLRI